MSFKPLFFVTLFTLVNIISWAQVKPYVISQRTIWAIINNTDTVHTLELDTLKISFVSRDVRDNELSFSEDRFDIMWITQIDSIKPDNKGPKIAVPGFSKSFIYGNYKYDIFKGILTLQTNQNKTLTYDVREGTPRGFIMIKKKAEIK